MTAEQRFIQANIGQDGHLTLAEARKGYPSIARHFQDIDTEDKGYVTQDDIRAWRKRLRAARRQSQAVEDHMSPRQAYQRYFPGQRQFNTSANRTVPRSEDGPAPMVAPEDEAR